VEGEGGGRRNPEKKKGEMKKIRKAPINEKGRKQQRHEQGYLLLRKERSQSEGSDSPLGGVMQNSCENLKTGRGQGVRNYVLGGAKGRGRRRPSIQIRNRVDR